MSITTARFPARQHAAVGLPWAAVPLTVLIGATLLGAVVFANNFNFMLRVVPEGEQFSVDTTVLVRLAICAACGLYGLFYLPRTAGALCGFPGAWSVLFGAWIVVTIPFAENLGYVVAACAALWCMILFAPAVLVQLGGRRVVLVVLAALAAYLVGSWLLYWLVPEVGRYGPDATGTMTRDRVGGNSLGFHSTWAIGMVLVLGTAGAVRWRALFLPLALAVVTLWFTQSRTSMIGALAIAGLFGLRALNATERVMMGCLAAALVAGLVAMVDVDPHRTDRLAEKLSRTGRAEEIYSMTGRTAIWEFTLERIREAPLVGCGHGAARYALAAFTSSGYDVNDLHHAHNQLLNVVLCSGVVGGLLVAAMLLHQTSALFRRPDAFADVATVFVLVVGLTEVVLFGPMPRSHTLIFLIALFWRQIGASVEDAPAGVFGAQATAPGMNHQRCLEDSR